MKKRNGDDEMIAGGLADLMKEEQAKLDAVDHDRERRVAAHAAKPTKFLPGPADPLGRLAVYEISVLKPHAVKEYVLAGRSATAMRYARATYGEHGWAEFVRLQKEGS